MKPVLIATQRRRPCRPVARCASALLPVFCLFASAALRPAGAAPANPKGKAASIHGPRIHFTSTTISHVGIQGGAEARYVFPFQNTGDKVLNITAVRPSCSCTIARSTSVVKPGGTGTITAVVQTGIEWKDETKNLAVFSNDPASPVVILLMHAGVIPAYTISPSPFVTLKFHDTRPLTQIFHFRSNRRPPIRLEGTPATTGPVSAMVAPDPAQPGGSIITVILTPPDTGQDVTASVQIPTNAPDVPTVPLTLMGLSESGINATPQTVDFGTIPAAGPATAAVALFSRTTPFHVVRIEADDPDLSVVPSGPAGASWANFQVRYKGGWQAGVHRGFVTFVTDRKTMPAIKVAYTAEVIGAPAPQ